MELKNKIFRVFLLFFCIVGLIAIRFFEDELFYDPFLNYFKFNYTKNPIPKLDDFRYFLHLFLRFSINSILSLAVLASLFRDKKIVKFSGFLLLVFFILLTTALFLILNLNENPSKTGVFYLRRFLIQPLFLLLFIPGFYFHNKTKIDS